MTTNGQLARTGKAQPGPCWQERELALVWRADQGVLWPSGSFVHHRTDSAILSGHRPEPSSRSCASGRTHRLSTAALGTNALQQESRLER